MMRTKAMRYIDYWLGLPLCFLLSTLNFIRQIIGFRRKKKRDMPKKLLFIKLSEVGAIILAYPLLKHAKEEYASAEIFFLTFKSNKNVFKILRGIIPDKNILTINEKSIWQLLLTTLRVIKKIRKEKIDVVFDLEFFSRFTAVISYLTKADVKIGFYRYTFEGLYRGNLFTHYAQYNPLMHIAKTYLSLLQMVRYEKKCSPELDEKIDDHDISLPKFISSPAKEELIYNKLKQFGINNSDKLFLLNPGEGTLPQREWPLDNFISLSKMLLEDTQKYIVIVGIENGSKKGETICTALQAKRCLNLIGKTNLTELLELFSVSEALIANDCGLAHLASLTPIKKFIIFGPESPQVFGPLGKDNWIIYAKLPCSPCLSVLNHRNSTCQDNKCLKIINPDNIYRLIKDSCR